MKKIYYLSAAAVLLSGCLSRDIKVQPDGSVPDTFANAAYAQGVQTDDAVWWASFGDAQLSALIEKALENNRSLKAAEASIGAAKAVRKGARAQLLPSVGLAGKVLSQETLIDPDGTTQGTLYGVAAQWELDIFGQRRNQARAANQMFYAEKEKLRGSQMLVASETAKAYLTWQNVAARTVVLNKVIAVQRRTLEVVEGRLPEGMSSTFDVDRAKATLAAAEAMLPKLEMAETQLRGALAVLTGQSASSFALDAGQGWSAISVPTPPSLLPSDVLLRRPDVQAALRTVEAQMFVVGAAKAAYYPKFDFNLLAANEDLQFSIPVGSNSKGPYYDLDGPVTDFALNATLPIFTFGKIRAAVKEQNAKLDAVAALYENTILQAVADVETAYHAFAATKRRADSLAQSERSAAAAFEKVQGLYEGGLADLTDVLTTQTAYEEQSDALLQGRLEHATAAIALHDALGGFPQPEKK